MNPEDASPQQGRSRHEPVFIICVRLEAQPVCVVGAGPVAARKISNLLQAGAIVHIIATDLCSEVRQMLQEPAYAGRIFWHAQPYDGTLPVPARLVFACTDDRQINERVSRDCRQAGILCNVADDPGTSDFYLPAVRHIGRLQIAVSTAGASPGLARRLADSIAGRLDPALADFADLLAQVRGTVLSRIQSPEARRRLLSQLCDDRSFEKLKTAGRDAWLKWFGQLLRRHSGPAGESHGLTKPENNGPGGTDNRRTDADSNA